jgi:uncharacterized protein with FMN-binding domain
MKRSLLIAGGTLGGLGAVLAVTPPQITSSESTLALPSTGAAPAAASATTAPAATQSATPAATKAAATKPAAAATTKSVKKSTATTSKTTQAAATTAASASASATPSATKTTAAASTAKSGTFTGTAINVGYGIVQVQITVENGKITDAQALSAPSGGRNERYTAMSIPVLRQRTLAAQGSNISGVSGASYTSYGWYKSLVSALAQAGMA